MHCQLLCHVLRRSLVEVVADHASAPLRRTTTTPSTTALRNTNANSMPEQTYEKVVNADGDAYSDSSGSDLADDLRNSSSSTRRRLRTSADQRRHDNDTLTAEEEAERLLTNSRDDDGGLGAIFKGSSRGVDAEKRGPRRHGEDELRRMEQGGRRQGSTESSGNSSEVDLQKLVEIQTRRKVGLA